MIFMNVLSELRDKLRPELKVNPEIVEREERLKHEDSNRLNWLLEHTYLTEGGLEELKEHPNFKPRGYYISYFAHEKGKNRRHRKVRVEYKGGNINSDVSKANAENQLKYDLHLRGANAGVFYRIYGDGEKIVAEAVPAMLVE